MPEPNVRHDHGASDCKQTLPECKNHVSETTEGECFPNPKVPYPCFSPLSRKERAMYIYNLKNNKQDTVPQNLIEKVKMEVAEFMKYLQDVSKACADDYNFMPTGASRYSEEYFKHCLDHMRNYPQVYSIQEITSLTGGKFVSDISLNFEKQLLAMGTIQMVEKRMLPENTQLAVDYESISAVIPPDKKATHFHTPISSDTNAEKLSATYEPHVCLAKEAFLQLLNNSAGFTEAWDLPVCVKVNPVKGGTSSKTVYIDPPLLKTDMTWRERSHLFHEESVQLAYKKTGSNPVFFLTSEDYGNRTGFATEETSSRPVVSFDSTDIDFEVDLTDLESFGESCQPKKKLKDNESKNQASSKKETWGLSKPKVELDKGKPLHTEEASPIEDFISAPAKEEADEEGVSIEDSSVDESAEASLTSVCEEDSLSCSVEINAECTPAKRIRCSSVNADSDEERLIIDDPGTPQNGKTNTKNQVTPAAQENITDPNTSSVSDLNVLNGTCSTAKGARKGIKRPRVSTDCDQLGQILRMQNAMLKSTTAKSQESPKAPVTECHPLRPKSNNHPVSLVKLSVSSYLDSQYREGLQNEAAAPATSQPAAQRKRLLKEALLVSAEDEEDYEAPEEGSVLYKLYSLLDVLLMVRSSASIALPRHDQDTFRAVPVHVLPKLEYQLCYGAECMTHTEACQLWAEQQLNSSTVSFIGRINAHTSKVVQLQELKPDWIQSSSCEFKPARCLNTLYHILKKLMSLQEGRYMLGHKSGEAFVTIFKDTDGKNPSRSVYNLEAVHCGLPVIPEAKIPWVPVDPYHLMPFHKKHCRPPCTFPPRPPTQPKARGCKAANPGNCTAASTQARPGSARTPSKKRKKKNKKKNTGQKNSYIQNEED
ncbi:little elongation complex subunit 2 isoform X2 [Silurus meridionalis]|nr:little elongation complex subunit 2 isoform X2 [Silurus meridionalis]